MPPRQPPLDRIADALESIADSLVKMSTPLMKVNSPSPDVYRVSPNEITVSSTMGSMLNPVTEAVHCDVCGLFAAVAEKHCNRRDCPSQEKTS
jgi:hypothetical protein